jgi:hypothetical protein
MPARQGVRVETGSWVADLCPDALRRDREVDNYVLLGGSPAVKDCVVDQRAGRLACDFGLNA